MNHEENRLQTFQDWPANAAVSAERAAKAGFFYTGQGQAVQCFLCGTIVSVWNYGDQAMAKHRLANPECPFVLDPLTTCNVAIIASSNDERNSTNRENDASQNNGFVRPNFGSTDLTVYINRLNTFENWPVPAIVSPERLARSGFYYLQQEDMVECAYCQGVVLMWEPGDDPDREHRAHFPNCDFYLREEDGDLSAEKVELGNVQLMPGTTSNFTELGIQHHSAPKQPKHATYESRLRSFEGWPTNLRQTPEMLADAGFYYVGLCTGTGTQDQVRCFHCDGGLRNWEETDDAWIEHAKWFPKCGYVALVRGQDFIKECVESRPPIDPAILGNVPDDNTDVAVTPPVSPVSPAIAPTQQLPRRVSDAELERLLGTPPAMMALEIGLHVGRIKMALKRRMEQTGVPYANADELIEDATHIQLSEEDNILNRQTPESPSNELTRLLNQIINAEASSSSSSSQTENSSNNEEPKKDSQTNTASSSAPSESGSKSEAEEKTKNKDDRTASLEEENRRLREAHLCKICLDREIAVVFLPCGHLSTCVFCAPSLTHCPMCRQQIRATVRTFLV